MTTILQVKDIDANGELGTGTQHQITITTPFVFSLCGGIEKEKAVARALLDIELDKAYKYVIGNLVKGDD